jgi:hypothetical protein
MLGYFKVEPLKISKRAIPVDWPFYHDYALIGSTSMELESHWDEIKKTFNACIASSKHCAIATVDEHGNPHITPIGFIFLKDDHTAYYFEEYTKAIPKNIHTNNKVCLMVVNSSFIYWFKSLLKGKFISPPGLRLYGETGDLRKASAEEIQEYKKKINSARSLKGSNLIWQGLETVREIKLTSFKPIQYPKMMSHLWQTM